MADGPSKNGKYGSEYDVADALGAQDNFATQCFAVYVPNKDQYGAEFGTQRRWVLEVVRLLSELNGGATAMPAVEGVWRSDSGPLVWEHPVVVYSFIRNDKFFANLRQVREFLHRMGRETNQGEVAVEYDGEFLLIRDYDPPESPTEENR